jgi:GWxTD domain-containing protein
MKAKLPALILLFAALAPACSLFKPAVELAPADAEFLSKVRYLISSEERRDFVALPDAEKPAFIAAFWQKRDPDPATEENELKAEYETRIEAAAKLFAGEGQDGFLTDRGRVYVLYGAPTERDTMPNRTQTSMRCSEIWYYGNFPVVFIDSNCTGRYRLSTFDMSPIRELDISQLTAQSRGGRPGSGFLPAGSKRFDYELELSFVERGPARVSARVRLRLPYGLIWFTSEARRLRTTFEVAVEVRTGDKELVFESKASFPVSLAEAELLARSSQDFLMDIPVDIRDGAKIARLGKGKDQLLVTVVNQTGKEAQKKAVDFS